jgi:hypothetical protein
VDDDDSLRVSNCDFNNCGLFCELIFLMLRRETTGEEIEAMLGLLEVKLLK